jgi:hypothetical protein
MVLRVQTREVSGGNNEKATPVPIPNTAVKLLSAENTWLVTAREDRSPPDLYQGSVLTHRALFIIRVYPGLLITYTRCFVPLQKRLKVLQLFKAQ